MLTKKAEKELLKEQKIQQKLLLERERIKKMSEYEELYSEYEFICGLDEVGRGPLAGPVIVGAVILPKNKEILYLNDSKKLSEKKREELYEIIMESAVATATASVSNNTIDEINILQATYKAAAEAIQQLSVKPDIMLNDAMIVPNVDESIRQVKIIKGDAKSISIAAASIIAKVTRDRLMVEYDSIFPGYDFASNKGYGTEKHIKALRELGPCPIHRMSFIKSFI